MRFPSSGKTSYRQPDPSDRCNHCTVTSRAPAVPAGTERFWSHVNVCLEMRRTLTSAPGRTCPVGGTVVDGNIGVTTTATVFPLTFSQTWGFAKGGSDFGGTICGRSGKASSTGGGKVSSAVMTFFGVGADSAGGKGSGCDIERVVDVGDGGSSFGGTAEWSGKASIAGAGSAGGKGSGCDIKRIVGVSGGGVSIREKVASVASNCGGGGLATNVGFDEGVGFFCDGCAVGGGRAFFRVTAAGVLSANSSTRKIISGMKSTAPTRISARPSVRAKSRICTWFESEDFKTVCAC